MSKTVKAVVFDMDGTILDSRELIYRAFEDVLAAYGVEGVTRQHMAEVTGKPIKAMYELLAPGHDVADLEMAHLRHHEGNLHLLKAYDDAAHILERLRQSYKLGIFTGFDQLTYERLDQVDLRTYFDSIVETTRYTKHKPDPEGLLLCMRELDVVANETVYIGDGITDMQAGQAAGVAMVVGITHGFSTAAQLQTAGATHIIDSLIALPELLSSIE